MTPEQFRLQAKQKLAHWAGGERVDVLTSTADMGWRPGAVFPYHGTPPEIRQTDNGPQMLVHLGMVKPKFYGTDDKSDYGIIFLDPPPTRWQRLKAWLKEYLSK